MIRREDFGPETCEDCGDLLAPDEKPYGACHPCLDARVFLANMEKGSK